MSARAWVGLLTLLLPSGAAADPREDPDTPLFRVRFDAAVRAEPFTGRVLVFLSKTVPEPRIGEPARPGPVFAADVRDVRPGEPVLVGPLAFPVPLAELEGGRYLAQAVLDADLVHPHPELAPGNPCSQPTPIELRRGSRAAFELVCDRRIPGAVPRETRYARVFEHESRLLSEFHGRPVSQRALVHLPEAWFTEPERRFPVFLFLSGFGASLEGFDFVDWPAPALDDVEVVAVYPDPTCTSGHSGFADSANNGPAGSAFVSEFLPALEAEYRGIGAQGARLLAGHSSGGWSALWLQVSHPGVFGYAWAASPDPVDFRDFMGVDLYAPGANLFRDEAGGLRPFCRLGNAWNISYMQEHSERERVLRGGVLGYFEALLGPRGADGKPEPLWDRTSGQIRPEIAQAWSRYDIGRIVRERWAELGLELDGRVAITMGDGDNFLLQGSVARLKETFAALGADVRVQLVAGDHFSGLSRESGGAELRALADAYRRWEAERSAAASPP